MKPKTESPGIGLQHLELSAVQVFEVIPNDDCVFFSYRVLLLTADVRAFLDRF